MIRLDLPPRSSHLLTVRGRRSGRLLTTSVSVLRSYLKTEPMGRRQIALDADAAEEDLRRAATQIPVLRAALTEPDDLRDGPNT
jgi:ribonuclease PH